jgi:hypothetical protein
MTTPRSRSLATALLTARSLAAALPPSYTINRDTTWVSFEVSSGVFWQGEFL